MTATPPTVTRADIVARARIRLADPAYLAHLVLRHGTGTGEEGDACAIQEQRRVMRDVARELGAVDLVRDYDPSTDECPPCTSPWCRSLAIQVQDARADWRAEVAQMLHLLPGSAGSDALEQRRAYRMLDWSVREALPACADVLAAALRPHDAGSAERLGAGAQGLRGLRPITDDETRRAAVEPLRALALDLARVLALALARALDLDLDLALARALDLALDRPLDLALALARALDRALARVLALALARALDRAPSAPLPSPVALLRELCEMRD